jgi:hypothetical protein
MERRFIDRFQVPKARVRYAKENFIVLVSRAMPLKDLSKYGACIELKEEIDPGYVVTIKISVPGKKSISVKGKIIWSNSKETDFRHHAGIQFLPFGKGRKYNSFNSRQKLEYWTNQFS